MPYTRVGPAHAAKLAGIMVLSLVGQSSVVDGGVARAQPSAAASRCIVLPNLPLSVGFADGTSIKSLQAQDAAIRDVLRGVKSWLCDSATTSQFLLADSLRSAIEQHQTLVFDQIRFDSQQPKQAHVLLTDSRIAISRRHSWEVQVDHVTGAWKVSKASDAPSSLFIE